MIKKIEVQVKPLNGKNNVSILSDESLSITTMAHILTSAVSLCVRSQDTNSKQAELLKNVITQLEEEFLDIDSFDDIIKY
jgi:hypothetical protein